MGLMTWMPRQPNRRRVIVQLAARSDHGKFAPHDQNKPRGRWLSLKMKLHSRYGAQIGASQKSVNRTGSIRGRSMARPYSKIGHPELVRPVSGDCLFILLSGQGVALSSIAVFIRLPRTRPCKPMAFMSRATVPSDVDSFAPQLPPELANP